MVWHKCKYICDYLHAYNNSDVVIAYSSSTSVNVLYRIINYGIQMQIIPSIDDACTFGDFNIVKWLYKHNDVSLDSAYPMYSAIAAGHLDIVKWLHYNCNINDPTHWIITNAVMKCREDVLEWLLTHRSDRCEPYMLEYSARYGYFKIVQLLFTHRKSTFNKDTITHALNGAAQNGDLSMCKYLYENAKDILQYRIIDFQMLYYSSNKYPHIIKYLYEQCPELEQTIT